MPDSLTVRVAQAVTDRLNDPAAGLALPAPATRAYLVVRDLTVSAGLQVTVVPAGHQSAVWDLAPRLRFDCTTEVWIQQRLPDISDAPADALVALAEAVAALFLGKRLAAVPGRCTCVGAAWQPSLDRDDLDKLGLFTSCVQLTFRATR